MLRIFLSLKLDLGLMIYRRFGKTEISMPVLSFGCMRSMQSWQQVAPAEITDESQNNLDNLVRTALGCGINHIETAHGYGSSEQQLGNILPTISRNDYILQSKAVPSQDPQEFVNKITSSIERLGVDYLDLLALHGINDHRALWYSCRKNGCLAAARKLQDQGLVRHIGFSGHAPTDIILEALNHKEDGGFEFCNIHWYYIFDANRDAIDCAAAEDIGIFIISPTDKGGHLHSPSPKLIELCEPLSPMLFNDLYCLDKDGVCTISVGASQPDHFDEHLKVLEFLDHNNRESFSTVNEKLRRKMADTTGHERPDHLWSKFPNWDQAPGNINIRMVHWLFNLYRGWDMENYARERYGMLNRGSSWVQGNDGSRAERVDFSEMNGPADLSGEKIRELLTEAHRILRKETKEN